MRAPTLMSLCIAFTALALPLAAIADEAPPDTSPPPAAQPAPAPRPGGLIRRPPPTTPATEPAAAPAEPGALKLEPPDMSSEARPAKFDRAQFRPDPDYSKDTYDAAAQ